jgi:phage terminase large subunit GpA-like protein
VSFAPSPIADWAQALAPRTPMTVAEWAAAHRRLPEASAARGARWDNATAPYLVGIMNAILEPGVRTIAVMKAAQCGASEAVSNLLGYLIEHAPSPLLLVHPTASAAEAYSKERLADMIASTPQLRRLVTDKRLPAADERPESTLALKMFPGGFLALGGANSPNVFARWAVRVAIGDDCDRFPPVVGEEGDPADLLRNRVTTFHDGVVIFVSTPTLKAGRIDTLYHRSDRRRWVVPCLACGHPDWVTWSDPTHWWVHWDDHDPATARLQCPRCEAPVPEAERAAWVARGRWQATATPAEPGAVGFHVPAMLSPFVTLPALVARWLDAQARGRETLRVFVNTALAEGWEDRSGRVEPAPLLDRREDYGRFPDGQRVEAPAPVCVITAGMDVQLDRVEVLVVGHGPEREQLRSGPDAAPTGRPPRRRPCCSGSPGARRPAARRTPR